MRPQGKGLMSPSMTEGHAPPRKIAGGFVLVSVSILLAAWRACRKRPLGIADFRTWLACHEMAARRCTNDHQRSPSYGFDELARLTGVSPKRARASVNRLIHAGLLAWSQHLIEFPEPAPLDDDSLDDTIGGGKGPLAIPRRILRLLVGGARPALIATVLALLLRCLSRGRGGFQSRGRVKASWIAHVFDVDLRRVKEARIELIDLGWITPEPSDQWAMNRWGRAYTIDLDWERAAVAPDPAGGPRLPPPPAAGGPRLPPPDLQTKIPFGREKTQKPAPGGPAGDQVSGRKSEEGPPSTVFADPVPVLPPTSQASKQSTNHHRSIEATTAAATGAGGGPVPPPRLANIRPEDLRDMGRLLDLHEQAVAGGQISASEADRLRFVAAAEHARSIGSRNPPGLFAWLLRNRRWGYVTQDDEDAASRRLKAHLFGPSRGLGGGVSSAVGARARLSRDAELVREVRRSLERAGYLRDPFPLVEARDSSWTRERWDAACAEWEVFCGGL
jgi:hypothetical protein